MADTFYPKGKENFLKGNIDIVNNTIKVALIDTGTYTYSALHENYSSLSGIVGTPMTLTSKTVTNGAIGGADITYSSVTGNTVEAVVIYVDSGIASTSYLIAYIDSITNSPIIPNGGDLTIQWGDNLNIAVL